MEFGTNMFWFSDSMVTYRRLISITLPFLPSTSIISPKLNGSYINIRIPDIKFESISLKAKPNANPVSPNHATMAEIFTPMVPSAVIKPTITIKFLMILARTREILA